MKRLHVLLLLLASLDLLALPAIAQSYGLGGPVVWNTPGVSLPDGSVLVLTDAGTFTSNWVNTLGYPDLAVDVTGFSPPGANSFCACNLAESVDCAVSIDGGVTQACNEADGGSCHVTFTPSAPFVYKCFAVSCVCNSDGGVLAATYWLKGQ